MKFGLSGGDRLLFFLPLLLAIFGLLMVFNASSLTAVRDFGDKYYFLKHQAVWFIFGVTSFLFFCFLDYRILKKLALPGFLITLLMLVVVLIPGVTRQIYGSRRWLSLAGFVFQPAELAKLTMTLYLATLFEKKRNFVSFLSVLGVILVLLILEPDMGTAIIILATAFFLYFIAGAPLKKIGITALLGLIVIPLLIIISPYRKQRLLDFVASSFNAGKASYHVRQGLIALGSGGIFGRGLGQSRQKFLFLPEVTTDSIFAVIAEEFGFVGAMVLILNFAFLLGRGMKVILAAPDTFGQVLGAGIIIGLTLQVVINLGAMVALTPLTGVPLPFISYGGSSLLTFLSGMGIVYNISRHKL